MTYNHSIKNDAAMGSNSSTGRKPVLVLRSEQRFGRTARLGKLAGVRSRWGRGRRPRLQQPA